MKIIKLPIYGIKVKLNNDNCFDRDFPISGTIESTMKEECPYCGKIDCYWDCVESLTYSHS